jgi:hypothetical protein
MLSYKDFAKLLLRLVSANLSFFSNYSYMPISFFICFLLLSFDLLC